MDSLARNALRLSLAGAGVAVLGAGFVGQASAAEAAPTGDTLNPAALDTAALDTSDLGSQMTGSIPSGNTISFGGEQVAPAEPTAVPTATTPSSDALPSLADTQAFQVPSVLNMDAPGLS